MKIRALVRVCLLSLAIVPASAWASESCSPAKKLVEGVEAFYGEQPDLNNVINPVLTVGVRGINGYPDPTHLLYRFEGFEHQFPLKDGTVQGLDAAAAWSKEGELCSIYKDGPLGEREDHAVSISVSFGFPFLRQDGLFSVTEIKEGAKDGSKIIKSLAPKGLGFAAPSLKTLIITPKQGSSDIPRLIFMRDGKPSEVKISRYGQLQYIRLKDMKSAKVDSLKIEGSYAASAFFKIDPEEIMEKEAKRLSDLAEEKN